MGTEDPGLLDPFFGDDTIVVRRVARARPRRLPRAPGRLPRATRARGRGRAKDRDRVSGAIVGIDTSTSSTSVAVLVPGGREVERRDDPRREERPRHAETLQPLLEQALVQAEVDVGRTSPASASASARAGSPACGWGSRPPARSRRATTCRSSASRASRRSRAGSSSSSAQELDLPGHPDLHGPVLAVIDARRGEVFASAYRHHRTTMEPIAITPGRAGRAAWPRGASGDAARCWASGTGRYAFVRSSNGPEWRCRPTDPASTASAP